MPTTNLDALRTRFQAVATPEEDWEEFLVAAAQDMIERRERQSFRWTDAQAEARATLSAARRPYADANAEFLNRHGLRGLSHLTDEELAAESDRIVAAMDPQARSDMEWAGFL